MTNQIDFFVAARASSIQWAKDILAIPADQLLILDAETTGLDNNAEIVQLAIIDGAGDVVINTFVHPMMPIPAEATAIHHITNQDVAVAPKWETVFPLLQKIVEGKTLVIYNKDYDLRLIKQSSIAAGISFPVIGCKDVQCAMQAYSEFVGEWNDYRGSFRWQKLTGGDHSALGDCRATLDLIRKMAATDHIEVADVTYPDIFQEQTTSARGIPATIESLLDRLAELRDSIETINLGAERRVNRVLTPEQAEEIRLINDARDTGLATTNEAISRLEEEIKAEILVSRTTIKGAHLMAVWNKGREGGWDNAKLKGFAMAHPEILAAKKPDGEPSVTIRTI